MLHDQPSLLVGLDIKSKWNRNKEMHLKRIVSHNEKFMFIKAGYQVLQFTDFFFGFWPTVQWKTTLLLNREFIMYHNKIFKDISTSIPLKKLYFAHCTMRRVMGQWDRAYLYAHSHILGSTINDKQWPRATWFHLTFPKKNIIFHTHSVGEVWSGENFILLTRAEQNDENANRQKIEIKQSSMFNDHCRVRVIILSLISKFVWICLFLGYATNNAQSNLFFF